MKKQCLRFAVATSLTVMLVRNVSPVAQTPANSPSLQTSSPTNEIKVRNILAFVRAKAPLVEAQKGTLGDLLGVPGIPSKLHQCFDPSPLHQDCLKDPAVREWKIAYANIGVEPEHDVVVLVRRTFEGGYFYLLSAKDGALKRAVHPFKIMNGDKVDHIQNDLLDAQDHAVIKDVQVQIDFWNDKYEKWMALQKKP